MFNAEKYKWICEQIQDGTYLHVACDAGYEIDITSVSYEDGIIKANGQFDITDVWIYGFNGRYTTMDRKYPVWKDKEYYYHDTDLYTWRALKNV